MGNMADGSLDRQDGACRVKNGDIEGREWKP